MKWQKPFPVTIPQEIIEEAGDQRLAEILYRRGFSDRQSVKEFLAPETSPAPDFSEYAPLDEATERLMAGIESGKKICVWGDYDVDGVTSTALLVESLQHAGADTVWHVPDRFTEGYGLNCEYIEKLAGEGVQVLLTCDCGISNHEETKFARALGMEVIITDHHEPPPELPEADVTVNLKLLPQEHPARDFPGVAAAFLVAARLLEKKGLGDKSGELLDLVALGIIADVVPLTGENRRFLRLSLPLLAKSPRLQKLYEITGPPQDEEDIGFQIAPRLNAAGRIENASLGVDLLLGQGDPARLDELNRKRKKLVDECLEEIEIEEIPPVIVLYNPQWHPGIVGIAAGRLCEKYQRPALVFTYKEHGTATGSARSIEGVNIYQALKSCEHLLTNFGGHPAAAGCTLSENNIPALRRELCKIIKLPGEKKHQADLALDLDEITPSLYYSLRKLAPFGEGNPAPVIYSENLEIASARPTKDDRHLQLVLAGKGKSIRAVWWWAGENKLPTGKAKATFNLTQNRFGNGEQLQLSILDLETTEEKPAPVKLERTYKDLRGISLAELLERYPSAQFFQEGPENSKYKNRYQVTKSNTLVLLSIPPGPAIFREILALSGAEEVVLAYSREPVQKNILKQLIGMTKYALNNYYGRIAVPHLAVALSVPENLVWKAFEELKHIVLYDEINQEEIRVLNVISGKINYTGALEKTLKEIKGFQRFMLRRSPEEIKKYF